MRDKHFGKCRLPVKNVENPRLLHPHDLAFAHRSGSRHAPQLAYQTALTQKFIRAQYANDGFFALVGNDG
jgi:hypothetical protein